MTRQIQVEVFAGWDGDWQPVYRTVTVNVTTTPEPPTPPPHQPEYLYSLPPGYFNVTDEDMKEVHAELRRLFLTVSRPPVPGGWIPFATTTVPVPDDEEWLPRWDELLPGEKTKAYAVMCLTGEDWNPELAGRHSVRPYPSNWFHDDDDLEEE